MASPSIFPDAAWGFFGALVYAGGLLSARLWAGEREPTPRERRLFLARFVLAITFGSSAAAAFTLTMHQFFGWAELRACAFIIGGAVNEVWPVVKKYLVDRILRFLDKMVAP